MGPYKMPSVPTLTRRDCPHMASYVQLLYHFVFATKNRETTLNLDRREELLSYSVGVIRGMDCHVYRINSRPEHMHILASLHAEITVGKFVKGFKLSTGKWLRSNPGFPNFTHWQEGYGGFSKSWEAKDTIADYIRTQDEHHKEVSFLDEFRRLVIESGLEWDDRYLP